MDLAETLQAALERLADQLLMNDEMGFSVGVASWYRKKYPCELTPRPTDTDPLRLAVKASIMERLVEVANNPPWNGEERVPRWCADIPGIDAPLKLQSDRLLEDEVYCPAFAKRNLIVVGNFMFFV